jgi:hypothetical protein
MNELQRQAYIEAMGIDSYFPRFTLPGAPVSTLCELPQELLQGESVAADVIVDTPLDSLQGNTADQAGTATARPAGGAVAAMQALFGDSDNKRKKPINTKATAQKSTEQVAATASVIPRFSLSVIRGANVLLVDEGLSGDADQVEYLNLLHNMLFALGAQVPQLSIERFSWPMVKSASAQFDQTDLAAKQTLQSFIAKQLSQLDNTYLLVMGDSAKHYLAAELIAESEEVAHGCFMTCATLGAQLICTHSASAMLVNPELKRDVWKDLQPLYRVLKKS